jgi:hypothetical protein
MWARVRLFTRGCSRGQVWADATGVAVGGFLLNSPRCHPYVRVAYSFDEPEQPQLGGFT